ncbi:MAG: hypothetical protein HYR66_02145 [Sphingobacteriales bacterium]|nr:hypothetical protein [Sphingobacteriales bacterium]MBI3718583.1 hypothetical protein [Sphingobacteriales bacterium]
MNKIKFYMIVVVTISTVSTKSFAQKKNAPDSLATDSTSQKSYVLGGAGYTSDIVFLGRKSSSRAPYFSVSAGYYHKTGLFISSSISYLAASGENRVDLFTASGGYDYYKKNFSAGVFATGYIFNNKSYTVKSALTANLSAYADYDFDILELYADGTLYFSNQSDFIFSAAISHNFYTANDNLKISPTFSLYSGTQNYYSNYNNNKRFGGHMLTAGGTNTMGTGMMSGGIFNIQNYEFSVPVRYDVKHFRFIFLPVYAMPVNPATITDNQNTYKEVLNNNFFWSVGVFYRFSKQKK